MNFFFSFFLYNQICFDESRVFAFLLVCMCREMHARSSWMEIGVVFGYEYKFEFFLDFFE